MSASIYEFHSYVEKSYCHGEGKDWNIELHADGRVIAWYREYEDELTYGYGPLKSESRVDIEGIYSKTGSSDLSITITKSEGSSNLWRWLSATMSEDETKLSLKSADGTVVDLQKI